MRYLQFLFLIAAALPAEAAEASTRLLCSGETRGGEIQLEILPSRASHAAILKGYEFPIHALPDPSLPFIAAYDGLQGNMIEGFSSPKEKFVLTLGENPRLRARNFNVPVSCEKINDLR